MSVIKAIKPLGFPWETQDPFLFCVFHNDAYPKGNGELAPDASLTGRRLGQDISGIDGWNMYHGTKLPGFPAHPHRGFETVTLVNSGWVDHADSLGGAGRFGNGDVQWMTAGKGIQHSEMFPLLQKDRENPLELFQIWLNLPKVSKLVEPHYKMLWSEDIPYLEENGVCVQIIAGSLRGKQAPAPAPDSWANDGNNEVAIMCIELRANSRWQLPACSEGVNRCLYFFQGKSVAVADHVTDKYCAIDLAPDAVNIRSYSEPVRLLVLQGRPINEPVTQYGPFVMNSEPEIRQAMKDYQNGRYGGWPWDSREPDHGPVRGRFAHYANGEEDTP